MPLSEAPYVQQSAPLNWRPAFAPECATEPSEPRLVCGHVDEACDALAGALVDWRGDGQLVDAAGAAVLAGFERSIHGAAVFASVMVILARGDGAVRRQLDEAQIAA